MNRIAEILFIFATLTLVGLGRHLTIPMWVAGISYLILCAGLRFRRHPLHPYLTLTALFTDLALVAVLQVQRGALQTAFSLTRPLLDQIHIAASATATALYFPVLYLGFSLWRGNSRHRRLHKRVSLTAFTFRTVGFAFMFSMIRPTPITGKERLASFPTESLPVTSAVNVYWNDYGVPFVHAQSDADAALALGLVHAHLRLGQMETLRRLSAGRVAEMAGPLAVNIDRAIRTLDLAHAVPAIERQLPPETRRWLTRYVEGVNLYQERMKAAPPDWALLGIRPEPWTVADVLRLSRLAGADVSWMRLLGYFALKDERGFEAFWARYRVSLHRSAVWDPFAWVSRTGSNSFVLDGTRTRSGKPLMANDPHLGLSLPNFWVLVGVKTPTLHAVGLSIPGIPFVALGRNPDIAWGGTNMHALSSDLFDVTDTQGEWKVQETPVAVRGWWSATSRARWTPWGPLISDISYLAPSMAGKQIALRWAGHFPSDEITAFLKANRARTPAQLRQAFQTYAVSGQNILYAARSGEIGQVFAVSLPRDRRALGAVPYRPPEEVKAWESWRRPTDFPELKSPRDGILVSANQKPPESYPPVGEFFSPPQRVNRLRQLLSPRRDWDRDSAALVQRDVYSETSFRLKTLLVGALRGRVQPAWNGWTELENWDGKYSADSLGALVYQALAAEAIREIYAEEFGPKLVAFLLSSEVGQDWLAHDLRVPSDQQLAALNRAVATVVQSAVQAQWGDRHRLRLGHLLAGLPVLGQTFVFAEFPGEGSMETVYKSAHSLGAELHSARYGAQARHISDLADPDANDFVLLGGQDGWWGSDQAMDQVPLWRRGEFVRVPLSLEKVAATFPKVLTLTPKP